MNFKFSGRTEEIPKRNSALKNHEELIFSKCKTYLFLEVVFSILQYIVLVHLDVL